MTDGRILVTDRGARQITRTVEPGRPPDKWVPHGAVTLSPDGSRLYVGLGPLADRSQHVADEILVVDTSTWQRLGSITTSQAFWSLTVSQDGRYLYAISPQGQRILRIDTFTYLEESAITAVGQTPALAIVNP